MSYQAYQKTQQASETPSQVEYRLLAKVTTALMDAEKLHHMDQAAVKALDWNRRVWSTLATDCAIEGNQLPKEIRAGIISLSIWVSKHTTGVIRGKMQIAPLISVNKSIMAGLAKQAELQQQAAANSQQTITQTDTSL
ncbi:flagellar biosynthesis regulator FlaF [Kordiimonas sp. SCSIO 12610]|uniref:flagellar biosynthesis regulator FlaF n=1 Tax=Kordiimonas sp. SCSIO 12610 TaxID=2829597 RepID=UPI00210B98AA|nr:flagellar biosynthesis regulator FlaF [Kordiimonas sp. SCSIO 12610]UTW54191.1 flagellar biosynthesis regulator FlaF [Kordiimonas sp. SCSIO 12610]